MTVQPDTNTRQDEITLTVAASKACRCAQPVRLHDPDCPVNACARLLARCEEAEKRADREQKKVRMYVQANESYIRELGEAQARAERAERVVEAAEEVAKLWTPEREGVEWFANAMNDLRAALAASTLTEPGKDSPGAVGNLGTRLLPAYWAEYGGTGEPGLPGSVSAGPDTPEDA